MAQRSVGKLTARAVLAAKAGRHSDGGGLYLVVSGDGRGKWVYRFTLAGKSRDMGLGSVRDVPLADARQAAADARRAVAAGRDPLAERYKARLEASKVPTFQEAADEFLSNVERAFRNAKHRAQWRATLRDYAKPILSKHVDQIETADVLRCLTPIWTTKPETASRVRGRIERVLDAARARDQRSGENPARWRGHLDKLLPKRAKLTRGHHAALRFDEVPDFMARLREVEGLGARALELTVLTAVRSGEALGARWSEFDLEARIWTIPAGRMKAAREHRVPLSPQALAILESLQAGRVSDFVFPGAASKDRKPRGLSSMAMAMTLRRMKVDVTVHGFRSAFRDWAGERTHFPREVAEAALAHVVGDQTERAYRRGDALDKRREMMDAWAAWCEPKGTNVVPFARPGA
jgi:integrase